MFININGKFYKKWGRLDISQIGNQPYVVVKTAKKWFHILKEIPLSPNDFTAEEINPQEIIKADFVSNIGKLLLESK